MGLPNTDILDAFWFLRHYYENEGVQSTSPNPNIIILHCHHEQTTSESSDMCQVGNINVSVG